MDGKENQLNLPSKWNQRRKLGNITQYGEYDKDEDLFTQGIISELSEAWEIIKKR